MYIIWNIQDLLSLNDFPHVSSRALAQVDGWRWMGGLFTMDEFRRCLMIVVFYVNIKF